MMRDALALEIRVLSGRHAGACAVARHGLLIGTDDRADVILSDLASESGLGCLHLLSGERWLLVPSEVELDAEMKGRALVFGESTYWNGLALSVCLPGSDWPSLPESGAEAELPSADMSLLANDETGPEAGVTDAATDHEAHAEEEPGPQSPRPPSSESRQRMLWGGVGLCIVLGALGLAAWTYLRPDSGVGAQQMPLKPEIDLTEQAARQIPDLTLSVAQVDPAMRMSLTPQRDGRVLVTGWVDSVTQYDRLADMLGTRRPAPILRVLVVSDVRAELQAQLSGRYSQLDFQPGGPGVLRVRGIVLTEAELNDIMASVAPLAPQGVSLQSDLRLAEKLVPEVRSALTAAGFNGVQVHWDGNQVVAALTLADVDRPRLERTLLTLGKQFPGLPLRVVPQLMTAKTALTSPSPSRSTAPFAIRGVIGGAVPYLVLPDGRKLLPGGVHAGWRLQSIEADVIVFDAPRRLVVAR